MTTDERASFCCSQGPYVVLVNRGAGGTVITVERAHPPFSVTLAVSDVCIGCDVQRGPQEPPETRILDRAPGLGPCRGEKG